MVSDFTELWDRLQVEEKCCGVISSRDYSIHLNRSYPESCCGPDVLEAVAAPAVFRTSVLNNSVAEFVVANASSDSPTLPDADGAQLGYNHILGMATGKQDTSAPLCQNVHSIGCVSVLAKWLKNRADILFVLGYCVIAFLKLSFLGILRYEIREMIQKIKLLQTEMANALCSDTEQPQSTTVSASVGLPHDSHAINRSFPPPTARPLRCSPAERDQQHGEWNSADGSENRQPGPGTESINGQRRR